MERHYVELMSISPYLRFIHTDESKEYEDYKYIIPWRQLYDYELVFLSDGELYVETEKESYVLHAGDVHIMPPFLRHRRRADYIKLYSVHFDMVFLPEEFDFSALKVYSEPIGARENSGGIALDTTLINNRPLYLLSGVDLPQKLSVANPLKYIEILSKAHKVFNEKPNGYKFELKTYLMRLLQLVISDTRSSILNEHFTELDRQLLLAVEYINMNFSKKIDMTELAQRFGFTLAKFRRMFKKHTDKYPTDYLIDMRINAAIDYLCTFKYPISEIAGKVGYDDIYYFSRIFKVRTGISPSDYVKRKKIATNIF